MSLLHSGCHAVVVVDHSDDHEVTFGILQHAFSPWPNVIVVPSATNAGFGAGIDTAAAIAMDKWPNSRLLVLNNDATMPASSVLGDLQKALDMHPDWVLVTPSISPRPPGWYHRVTGLLLHRYWPGAFDFPAGAAFLWDPVRAPPPLFDHGFFMYGEDVMLGWCWRRRWGSAVTLPVTHSVSASTGGHGIRYETWLNQAHWRLAWLTGTPWGWPVRWLCRLPVLTLRAALRAWRDGSVDPWRGWWYGLAGSWHRPDRRR